MRRPGTKRRPSCANSESGKGNETRQKAEQAGNLSTGILRAASEKGQTLDLTSLIRAECRAGELLSVTGGQQA